MSGRLDEIEQWVRGGNFNFAAREDVLLLVEIARAAREVVELDKLLGFNPRAFADDADALAALRAALARLDATTTEQT